MFERILNRMRELVHTRQYVMTMHAEEEMDSDDLTIYDVESVVLTGEITERQKDRVSADWKYLVSGQSLAGDSVNGRCQVRSDQETGVYYGIQRVEHVHDM